MANALRSLIVLALLFLTACQGSNIQDDHTGLVAVTFDGAGASGQAAIAHGQRISRVLGCHGCHGDDLQGQKWDDDPNGYGLLWTSNLTRSIAGMSDAQLEALLRQGIHPTRPQLWAMPSQIFQHMSDADLAALTAYLRSLKPAGEVRPAPVLGPKAIAQWRSGEFPPAADQVKQAQYRMPPDLGSGSAQGRYIVSMTCTECHGGQLTGQKGEDGATPDLIIAGGYSRDEFEKLLTTGVPSGGRKLKNELMSVVAKSRFSHMTKGERDAVYAFLKARAERAQ